MNASGSLGRWRPHHIWCVVLMITPLLSQDKTTVSNRDGQAHGWTDPRTKLTWMPWDNNEDVTWTDAKKYCRDLDFDGRKDWRLPSIEELDGIYDGNASGGLAGPIERSSDWLWSATHSSWGGNWGSAAWMFSFVRGGRMEHGVLTFRNYRALCVRDPAE